MEQVSFLERSQTLNIGGLTVTAAVHSHEESEDIFGRPLAERGIRPVWLEIKNGEDVPYILISRSLEPTYFSASEVVYMHMVAGKNTNKRITDDHGELDLKYWYIHGEERFYFILLINVFVRYVVNYHIGLSCTGKDPPFYHIKNGGDKKMKKIILIPAVLLALPFALAFRERSEASPIVVVDALLMF